MNPGYSQNNGKYRAWAALGYEVGNAAARLEDARADEDTPPGMR